MEGHLAIMAIMNLARQNGWAHPEWVSSRIEDVTRPSVGSNGINDGVPTSMWQCEVRLPDCAAPCNQPVLGRTASSKKVAKQQAAVAWMGTYARQQAREVTLEEGEVKENVSPPKAAAVRQEECGVTLLMKNGPTALATGRETCAETAGAAETVAPGNLAALSTEIVATDGLTVPAVPSVAAAEDDGCLSDE
jgi:hypothetical protein